METGEHRKWEQQRRCFLDKLKRGAEAPVHSGTRLHPYSHHRSPVPLVLAIPNWSLLTPSALVCSCIALTLLPTGAAKFMQLLPTFMHR